MGIALGGGAALRIPRESRMQPRIAMTDHIRYDLLTQQALRGVVRNVLADAAKKKGLPGDHHFYITFDTTRRRRAHVGAAARAISGGDDHHPAAPVLGSQRERATASRSACRSAAFRKSSPFRSRRSTVSSTRRCSSACNSRKSTEGEERQSGPANVGRTSRPGKKRVSAACARASPRACADARTGAGSGRARAETRQAQPAAAKSSGSTASARRNNRAVLSPARLPAYIRAWPRSPAKPAAESDAFGPLEIPADKLWGAQTERSLHNFRIGTERMPIEIVRALGLIKRAAAEVNRDLGSLDAPARQAPSSRPRRTSPTASSTSISRCWSGRPAPARRPT